jgi:hypothetical protein
LLLASFLGNPQFINIIIAPAAEWGRRDAIQSQENCYFKC